MSTEIVSFKDNLVVRDAKNTWRWLDAFGSDIVKRIDDFVSLAMDDTTGLPTEWTNNLVNASTIAHTPLGGGAIIFTGAGAENDGAQMQLKGESFDFSARYPFYMGVKFQAADVDQSDFLLGLSITDTTAIGGVTDGLYVRSVDETAALLAVAEKDSVESTLSIATMADATDITVEFFYNVGVCSVYVNGSLAGTFTDADTNWPDDELLTPTLAFLSGEAAANTMTVKWARFIQVRNA